MAPNPRHLPLMTLFLLPITGSVAETFLRAQNITATEGSTVTLQCHLLIEDIKVTQVIEDIKVTQVNWNFCNNQHIAFHVNYHDTKGMVVDKFSDRVSLAKDYGITISGINRNDTGQYCCIFNTFPLGKFTGRIYLQVLSKVSWTHGYYLWYWIGLGILIAVVVVGIGSFYYKKKKSQAVQSNIHPKTSGAKHVGSIITNSAPIMSTNEDKKGEYSEYFNV
ncbi:negative regulation of interleukin-12 production, partial [Pristimantis euphronides]